MPEMLHQSDLKKREGVAVVIPAYNEGTVIGDTLSDLVKYIDKNNIVVVNDGSTDKTGKIIQKYGVRVINHFLNRGAGAAVKTGIEFALKELNAAVVVLFDADGQHFPEDIEKIIQPILNKDAEIVIGSRFLNKENEIPFFRIIANKTANMFTYLFFGIYVTDSQSGFRALGREAAEKINIKFDSFEFCSEMIAEIKQHHLKFKEVPIRVRYSEYSLSKGQNFFKGLSTLYRLFLKKIL